MNQISQIDISLMDMDDELIIIQVYWEDLQILSMV